MPPRNRATGPTAVPDPPNDGGLPEPGDYDQPDDDTSGQTTADVDLGTAAASAAASTTAEHGGQQSFDGMNPTNVRLAGLGQFLEESWEFDDEQTFIVRARMTGQGKRQSKQDDKHIVVTKTFQVESMELYNP